MDRARRMLLVQPLREVVTGARAERARLALESAERQFYLGVEAAAWGVLHPETLAGRAEGWMSRESSAFREGYLAMQAEIAATVATDNVPIRLPLPEPRAGIDHPAGATGARRPI